MAAISSVLYPIIYLMRLVLEFGYDLFGSYGLAIVFLSVVVSAVMAPLSRITQRIQVREHALQLRMQPELMAAKASHSGEARFIEIEKIYKKYDYHPIKSIRAASGLLLKVPFLLSALVMLWDYPPLQGVSFVLIDDLGRPDGYVSLPSGLPAIFGTLNVLPFLTTLINIVEAYAMPGLTRGSRRQMTIISVVLLVLVYPLPAAIVFYWVCSNVWSLAGTLARRFAIDRHDRVDPNRPSGSDGRLV